MSTPPPDESGRPAGWPDYPARPDYPGYPAGSPSGGPAYPPTYPAAPGPGRPAYPGQPAYPGYPVYLPTPSGTGATPAPVPEVCTWHPDRQTALHCTRCGRPACPECLTPASVGFQCRACVAEGRATQRTALTVSGSPTGQQPVATIGLIIANVLIFVVTVIQAGGTDHLERSSWFSGGVLVPSDVAEGEWWRLITSGFLHLSITHIALNMVALYFVGLPLERVVGRWRFLVIYFLSLLGGSVAVMLFADPDSGAVGASGAIFGLMGALVAVFLRFRYDLRQVVFVVVINLGITFVIPGISWQAHVGGLVVGGLAGAAMVYPPAKSRLAWQIGASVGLLVVLGALLVIAIGQIPV